MSRVNTNEPHLWRPGDPIKAEWLNQIVDAVVHQITGGPGILVNRTGRNVSISLATLIRSSGVVMFPAMITGNQTISTNRWRYSWEEVEWSPGSENWDILSAGRTSTDSGDPFAFPAYNGAESPNDGSGDEGVGVDTTVSGVTLTMQPIADGVVVYLDRYAEDVYAFALPNAWDVECDE